MTVRNSNYREYFPSVLGRLTREPRYYLGELYRLFMDKAVLVGAQAVAFKALVASVPILVLITGVVGRVLTSEERYDAVARLLREFLPAYQSENVLAFAENLQRLSGTLTVVGVLGLLVASVSLFSTLRAVISNVFTEEWHDQRSVLRGYAFDIRLAIQVGILFIVTVTFTLYNQSLEVLGVELFDRVGLTFEWLVDGWGRILRSTGLLLPVVLSTLMFFQLYYLIPVPHPPTRSVSFGAVFAAILWETGKHFFTIYATRVGIIERYSGGSIQDGGAGAIGDTFGIMVALVLWAYYSGVVLMIGALLVLLYERRHRSRSGSDLYAIEEPSMAPRRFSQNDEQEDDDEKTSKARTQPYADDGSY